MEYKGNSIAILLRRLFTVGALLAYTLLVCPAQASVFPVSLTVVNNGQSSVFTGNGTVSWSEQGWFAYNGISQFNTYSASVTASVQTTGLGAFLTLHASGFGTFYPFSVVAECDVPLQGSASYYDASNATVTPMGGFGNVSCGPPGSVRGYSAGGSQSGPLSGSASSAFTTPLAGEAYPMTANGAISVGIPEGGSFQFDVTRSVQAVQPVPETSSSILLMILSGSMLLLNGRHLPFRKSQ